ncbi:hypothetical protein [Serinicoccus profundi]|uniref:hypothetical protein n=1 Tax=Serinicoccus profundi TaxID=1078471 RepID=UPI000308F6CB|nr:hypothetical protein [Serinicoccus profundi]
MMDRDHLRAKRQRTVVGRERDDRRSGQTDEQVIGSRRSGEQYNHREQRQYHPDEG